MEGKAKKLQEMHGRIPKQEHTWEHRHAWTHGRYLTCTMHLNYSSIYQDMQIARQKTDIELGCQAS
jgi:hypothetical protein